ncbi:hypothetical protein [Dactylosporangium darangshiense]
MTEMPARRGWRGEAAGIPPAHTRAPSTAISIADRTPARRPRPGRPLPQTRDDFPLWPTNGTLLKLETARPPQWPPPAKRVIRAPRGPLAGLGAMMIVALLAGFFAWTSAEPFWMDMGHGVRGTAEVTACEGSGVLRRCVADFAAPGRETVDGAQLMGLDAAPGTSVDAEMVPGGRIAYAGNPSGLRVRWATGLGLIVLCGIVLAWLTGGWRFDRLRDRLTAWGLTALAPLVLGAGIVLAAY